MIALLTIIFVPIIAAFLVPILIERIHNIANDQSDADRAASFAEFNPFHDRND